MPMTAVPPAVVDLVLKQVGMIACCMIMVGTNGEADVDVFGFFLIGFESGNNANVSGSVVGRLACRCV